MMGKPRGLPGTPEDESLEHGHQPSEEDEMQRASDKSWSNSHANLMNEGEDDDWRSRWSRADIEQRKDSDGDGDDGDAENY